MSICWYKYIRTFACVNILTNVTLWWSALSHFFYSSFLGIRWTKHNYWGDVPTKKVLVFMSVELSNFCWSECQHTRKVCIFLFQAITLQNFSSFLDLKTNWLYNTLKNHSTWGSEKWRDAICSKAAEFESHLRCWLDIIQLLFNLQTCISQPFQNRSQNIWQLSA